MWFTIIIIYIIIIIIIIILLFFYTSIIDCLSLEFEWQQVSSSCQDMSPYSGWSLQCCSLDHPNSSSNLLSNPLETIPSALIIIDITITFIFHSSFLVLWQGLSTCLSFQLLFHFVAHWNCKIHLIASCLLFISYLSSVLLADIRWSVCISKSQRILCISLLLLLLLFHSL